MNHSAQQTYLEHNMLQKHFLVGGLNPSEKYESQLGLFPIYGNNWKQMFQTTNQFSSSVFFLNLGCFRRFESNNN